MRRHARSERRGKILRRGRGGEGAAEIGSRVFPFRAPPAAPASMPSVGTRRSTRVFVPKHQPRPSPVGGGGRVGVLRSGKRFTLSAKDHDETEWIKTLRGGGDWWSDEKRVDLWPEEKEKAVCCEEKAAEEEKKLFGAVYSRKRRRSTTTTAAHDAVDHRRYGVVFERRQRNKKVRTARPSAELKSTESTTVNNRKPQFVEFPGTLVEKLGISDCDLWSGLECGPVVLAAAVDTSVDHSSDRFQRLLVSVMNWMRRARVELLDLVAFLFGRSIGSILSLNGIHFLPILRNKNRILDRNSLSRYGLCMIYGSSQFLPQLSFDCSALPSYFKFLNSTMGVRSFYAPSSLRLQHLISVPENSVVPFHHETHTHDLEEAAVKKDRLPSGTMVISNGLRQQRFRKKRSSLKNGRSRKLSDLRFGSFSYVRKSPVATAAKQEFPVSSVHVKLPELSLPDLLTGRDSSDTASSPNSGSKFRKSSGTKSPTEYMRELRSALAEVRQNIESACCNANILVSDSEKCWREDGAQVMMEMSESQEWLIAVKRGDVTRFLHKPQELRPCGFHKYTHAPIWSSGEDCWKLEFCDKWDWHVFKELHMECRDRNTQDASLKVIPVPGVREVSGYEDDVTPSFARPDTYIHMIGDEVGRALASKTSLYDMDSADEEWLRQHSSMSDPGSSSLSEENFERIVFAFEKDAFSCPDDPGDKERAVGLCLELGSRDTVSAIYEYWSSKKKKQKRGQLIKVFQGPPLRKSQVMQKQFLRRKRSFKRKRTDEPNQGGRGKSVLSQVDQEAIRKFHETDRETIRRVREAEAAVRRATAIATQLRTVAQTLMSNADLAAYKAAMTLRIAETLRIASLPSSPESPDLDSSILFD